MKKIKPKETILYQCFRDYINKKKDRNGFITHQQLDFIIYVLYHVPRERRNLFIAELIEMDYIEVFKSGIGNGYCYKVLK